MSHIEHHRIVWARADVASAHMRLIVEQAVQQRFERAQAWVIKRQIELHMLAEVIRAMQADTASEGGDEGMDVLDTATILACHHGMQRLFEAVRSFEPLAKRFLSEHRSVVSDSDLVTIGEFIAWVKHIEPRLNALRNERLNKLEADLETAGRDDDGAGGDWDVTIADGLNDDSTAC